MNALTSATSGARAATDASAPSAGSRTLSRRNVLKLGGATAVAGALAPALAACSSSGGGGSSSSTSKTLSYVIMGTSTYSPIWDAEDKNFEALYPGVKLNRIAIPAATWSAYVDDLKVRIASGEVPDIIQVATEGMYTLAATGILQPLNDYISADKSYIDSYYAAVNPNFPAWLKLTSPPGSEVYYLPGEDQSMCMWLNMKLFKEAGIPAPSEDWTWNDFLSIARQIKAKTGAYAYTCDYGSYQGIQPWLQTNGGNQMSADWKTITMDTPENAEAAEFVTMLIKDGLAVAPSPSFDDFAYQAKGKVAMVGCGRWEIIEARQYNVVDDLQIVQFPINKQHGSPVGWDSYGISTASKNKELAWNFLKFLTSVEYNQTFAKLPSPAIPARTAVATSSLFTANAPAGTTELLKALDYSTPIPSPINNDAIENTLQTGWADIVTGSISVSAGLTQLQEKMSQQLAS
jgi:multiple sugar transport system substrate-binding protein